MATINSANMYTTPYLTGEINYPGQCSFMAYLSSTATDVTGDGTYYKIIPDTELWDVGSNYDNTTGVFTAPYTSLYQFVGGITYGGLAAGNTIIDSEFINSALSSEYVSIININGGTARDANNQLTFSKTAMLYLTASDTVCLSARAFSTTKVVDIIGGATVSTYFGAFLVG